MNQETLHKILMVSLAKLAESFHSRIDSLLMKSVISHGEASEIRREIEDIMDSILWENRGKITMGVIDSINLEVAKRGGSFL